MSQDRAGLSKGNLRIQKYPDTCGRGLSLALKQRLEVTRKWPNSHCFIATRITGYKKCCKNICSDILSAVFKHAFEKRKVVTNLLFSILIDTFDVQLLQQFKFLILEWYLSIKEQENTLSHYSCVQVNKKFLIICILNLTTNTQLVQLSLSITLYPSFIKINLHFPAVF